MKTERFEMKASDGTALQAVLWQPEGNLRAILQITHGMTEHAGRYEKLAADLCAQGIAVAGFDLRGHGRNPGSREVAAFGEGGWSASLEDMRLFFLELNVRFPGIPHLMLGFSLGSFLLREYLGRYPEDTAGAIIAGTGHQPGWLLSVMMAIVRGQVAKAGVDGTTDLVRQLSFGTYNQKFRPNRTTADWLCSDEEALNTYLEDPLVRKDISAGLFLELLGSMKRTGGSESYAGWNREMPVLLLYGTEDPVGDSGKGVPKLHKLMKKGGMRDVECQQFPGGRHDIFHEESGGTAESVRHCICDWISGLL